MNTATWAIDRIKVLDGRYNVAKCLTKDDLYDKIMYNYVIEKLTHAQKNFNTLDTIVELIEYLYSENKTTLGNTMLCILQAALCRTL